MNRLLRALSALFVVALATPSWAAIEYTGLRSVGAGSAALRITTDGTLGVLSQTNILDWTVTVTDPFGQSVLTGPLSGSNSYYGLVGDAVSASTSGLSYDFGSSGGGYLFFAGNGPVPPGGTSFWCLQTNYCYDGDNLTEGLGNNYSSTYFSEARSGVIQFASAAGGGVGAGPEPGTWAMMIFGFGVVGSVMRPLPGVLAAA
jgi:hypothetical protein